MIGDNLERAILRSFGQTIWQTNWGIFGGSKEGPGQGQQDHGTFKQLGGIPLVVLPLPGPPGLPSGSSWLLGNTFNFPYLGTCQFIFFFFLISPSCAEVRFDDVECLTSQVITKLSIAPGLIVVVGVTQSPG